MASVRWASAVLCALGSVLFLGACERAVPQRSHAEIGGPQHPMSRFLYRPIRPTDSVVLGSPSQIPSQLAAILSPLADSRRATEVPTGPMSDAPGEPPGIAIDAHGRTYVLDSRNDQVEVFERGARVPETVSLNELDSASRAEPTSLAVGEDGKIYVGDLSRRISVIERRATRFTLVATWRVDIAPLAMCIMGSHLWAHGVNLRNNYVIHEFDLKGRLLNEFGHAYRSNSPIINYVLSRGKLACDEADGRIVYAPSAGIGEVYGYNTQGRLVWLTRIVGYVPADIRGGNAGYSVRLPPSGDHALRSLVSLSRGWLLAQYEFVTPQSRQQLQDYQDLYTVAIKGAGGQATYLTDSIPPLDAAESGVMVGSHADLHPQLVFYQPMTTRENR